MPLEFSLSKHDSTAWLTWNGSRWPDDSAFAGKNSVPRPHQFLRIPVIVPQRPRRVAARLGQPSERRSYENLPLR